MSNERDNDRALVFSYLALRKTIGILGIAFPFVVSLGALILFHTGLLGSLSSYYHTGMRDVFVGALWAIGFFLLSYRGYERRDDVAGDIACLSAIGVAVFPTTPGGATGSVVRAIGIAHQVCAVVFFVTLIYFSLVLFTRTDPSRSPTRRKLERNRVYETCGYVMGSCMVLIAIHAFLPQPVKDSLTGYHPVYWLETAAIVAFGVSWFTKGEGILKDSGPAIPV